jgi:hypothetical protein
MYADSMLMMWKNQRSIYKHNEHRTRLSPMERAVMVAKLRPDTEELEKFAKTLPFTSPQRGEFSKGHQERMVAAAKTNARSNGSPNEKRWDPANDGLDIRGADVKYGGRW